MYHSCPLHEWLSAFDHDGARQQLQQTMSTRPFDTGYLPLSYSGNPGADGVSYREGRARQRLGVLQQMMSTLRAVDREDAAPMAGFSKLMQQVSMCTQTQTPPCNIPITHIDTAWIVQGGVSTCMHPSLYDAPYRYRVYCYREERCPCTPPLPCTIRHVSVCISQGGGVSVSIGRPLPKLRAGSHGDRAGLAGE